MVKDKYSKKKLVKRMICEYRGYGKNDTRAGSHLIKQSDDKVVSTLTTFVDFNKVVVEEYVIEEPDETEIQDYEDLKKLVSKFNKSFKDDGFLSVISKNDIKTLKQIVKEAKKIIKEKDFVSVSSIKKKLLDTTYEIIGRTFENSDKETIDFINECNHYLISI